MQAKSFILLKEGRDLPAYKKLFLIKKPEKPEAIKNRPAKGKVSLCWTMDVLFRSRQMRYGSAKPNFLAPVYIKTSGLSLKDLTTAA